MKQAVASLWILYGRTKQNIIFKVLVVSINLSDDSVVVSAITTARNVHLTNVDISFAEEFKSLEL